MAWDTNGMTLGALMDEESPVSMEFAYVTKNLVK